MTMTDPIADMLTRIRNAQKATHEEVDIPCSKVKTNITEILKAEGFIRNFKIVAVGPHKNIKIFLKYDEGGAPIIAGLKRISKPSCRVYKRCEDIPKVLNGYGINIISSSKGLLSDREAAKLNVGGEVLCSVW